MTATLDAVPLARRITEHAYKAGASLVTTLSPTRNRRSLRFRYGSDASFDAAPAWLYEGMAAGIPQRRRAPRDRRQRSCAALERGSRKR